MDNNDILRRIRYIFDFSDQKTIDIFSLGGIQSDRAEISNWLKKDTDPEYCALNDFQLAAFLNGMIVFKRGKKEGVQLIPEKKLNNNAILRKLKIALNLKDNDLLHFLKLAGLEMSRHELSAFFRKPGQSQYRDCKDQVLRKLLQGLQVHFREKPSETK